MDNLKHMSMSMSYQEREGVLYIRTPTHNKYIDASLGHCADIRSRKIHLGFETSQKLFKKMSQMIWKSCK